MEAEMVEPVKVFVGTDSHMIKADTALEYSIRKHCSVPVEFVWMDYARGAIWDGWDIGRERGKPYSSQGWATDFSCFRFAIPEANGFKGRAIYLDADMVVLKDINQLFTYPMNHPVLVTPKRFDVILFDCAAFKDLSWWPSIEEMKKNHLNVQDYQKLLVEHDFVGAELPLDWNCCDGIGYDPEKTCLIHYTNMHTQPWKPYPDVFKYPPHPRPDMVQLWWKIYEEAMHENAEKEKEKWAQFTKDHKQDSST